jgi:phosphoserine / homoserine phosphotransferase
MYGRRDKLDSGRAGTRQPVARIGDSMLWSSRRITAMHLVCLDLEGVLVPEIWITFADVTGIPELRRTTRDEPDYDKLMKYRLGILAEHGLKLADIQKVIGSMSPLDGAGEFLSTIKERTQVVILSDTFSQFAKPLMAKLGYPTLFCNSLVIDNSGSIIDYRMRQKEGKRKSVEAFKTLNFTIFAAGDSFNDLSMIRAADAGCLFRPPASIRAQCPDIPSVEDYKGLLEHIEAHLSGVAKN